MKIFYATFFSILHASLVSGDDLLTKYNGDDCYRDCSVDSEPRICYWKWHLEHYHTLGPACGRCATKNANLTDCFNPQCTTADGVERGVMSINRQIPGPPIHVCHNDTIVVDIVNLMAGTTSTIHWHGLHQRETPWMDGVPYVTQCPIDFAATFRYKFRASEPGTQFYHSHTGHHKANGHYGGLVIRRPKIEDPNRSFYDHDLKEHLIVVSDWMNFYAEMYSPGLTRHPRNFDPTNVLINGKGTVVDGILNKPRTATPLAFFRVRPGQRYRFRFVNSMSHSCPASLEIQGHSLQILASDSFDLQPVTVDSLVSTSGERFDFVVNANQKRGNFWIRVRALGRCENYKTEQFAVLSYEPFTTSDLVLSFPTRRFPRYAETFGQGRSLNHPNASCSDVSASKKELCITDLSSYEEHPNVTDVQPDHRFFLGFLNYQTALSEVVGPNKYGHFMSISPTFVAVSGINNISMTSPPFSLLTQPEDFDDSLFCDENNIPESCDGLKICPCIHRIKIPLDSVVELIVVDEASAISNLNHPFHLHGNKVLVMGMGQHPDQIPMTVRMSRRMLRQRTLAYAQGKMHPLKDTVSIPSRGYTIFRFKADNPGWWLLHCHFEWHALTGMGLVVQVGESSEMPSPPADFPKCNSYTPDFDV